MPKPTYPRITQDVAVRLLGHADVTAGVAGGALRRLGSATPPATTLPVPLDPNLVADLAVNGSATTRAVIAGTTRDPSLQRVLAEDSAKTVRVALIANPTLVPDLAHLLEETAMSEDPTMAMAALPHLRSAATAADVVRRLPERFQMDAIHVLTAAQSHVDLVDLVVEHRRRPLPGVAAARLVSVVSAEIGRAGTQRLWAAIDDDVEFGRQVIAERVSWDLHTVRWITTHLTPDEVEHVRPTIDGRDGEAADALMDWALPHAATSPPGSAAHERVGEIIANASRGTDRGLLDAVVARVARDCPDAVRATRLPDVNPMSVTAGAIRWAMACAEQRIPFAWATSPGAAEVDDPTFDAMLRRLGTPRRLGSFGQLDDDRFRKLIELVHSRSPLSTAMFTESNDDDRVIALQLELCGAADVCTSPHTVDAAMRYVIDELADEPDVVSVLLDLLNVAGAQPLTDLVPVARSMVARTGR